MIRFLVMCLCLFSSSVFAWQLQPDISTVNFVSVKKDSVGEVHRFKKLQGSIDATGAATLTIALDSVDTGVEIRDQRMREMLFEVTQFPAAVFRTNIDSAAVAALKCGEQVAIGVKGDLALHGKTAPVTADLVITKLADGKLSVISSRPTIITAEAFDLAAGVAKLVAAVNLPAISTAVPVTFALVFVPEPIVKTLSAPTGLRVQ